jgi:hypothetical protein
MLIGAAAALMLPNLVRGAARQAQVRRRKCPNPDEK